MLSPLTIDESLAGFPHTGVIKEFCDVACADLLPARHAGKVTSSILCFRS